MNSETLRLFKRQSPVNVLGPGKQAVIWVQGCRFACPSCIVPDSWDENAGDLVTVTELVDWVLAVPGIEGVTFSGGEPMLQAEALSNLVDKLRDRTDLGIMCYTGYRIEHLQQQGTAAQQTLLQKIDLLIDGLYIEKLHGDLLWRGSANQRLLPLTERYRTSITALLSDADTSAGLEFFMGLAGEISFVGVPNKPGFSQEFEARMLKRGVIVEQIKQD